MRTLREKRENKLNFPGSTEKFFPFRAILKVKPYNPNSSDRTIDKNSTLQHFCIPNTLYAFLQLFITNVLGKIRKR